MMPDHDRSLNSSIHNTNTPTSESPHPRSPSSKHTRKHSKPKSPYSPSSENHHRRHSSPLRNSYFAPQPSSPSEPTTPRSPSIRRPPASRSSHGIETSHGPPPAIVTRGSYSNEIKRRSQDPADFAFAHHQLTALGLASPKKSPRADRTFSTPGKDSTASENSPRPHASRHSSDSTSRDPTLSSATTADDNTMNTNYGGRAGDMRPSYRRNMTVQNVADLGQDGGANSGNETGQSEDLFLNLAEDSPRQTIEDDGLAKPERRRSRIARSQRQSLPANTYSSPLARPDSSGRPSVPPKDSPASGLPKQTHYRRASHLPTINTRTPARESSPIASAGVIETQRSRYPTTNPASTYAPTNRRERETTPDDRQIFGRRSSIAEPNNTPPVRTNTYRPSNLNYSSRNNDSHIDTPPEQPSKSNRTQSRGEGTDSVDSMAAPSTVWDELDDLKSRIRKLELTGKLPSTSGAAVGNGERPQTATTSVTTVSSSPKRAQKSSVSPSESTTPSMPSHPLLHSSLARCKSVLEPHVFRYLDNMASEALEMASMTSNPSSQGLSYTTSDRQLRRKADGMCRTLTELCIALADGKSEHTSPTLNGRRRGSKDMLRAHFDSSNPSTPVLEARERQGSMEPEFEQQRNSPSRALKRIEARRSSVIGLPSGGNSPREGLPNSATPTQSHLPNRFSRAGTSLLRNRSYEYGDDDEDPTLRAPSRAMTEISSQLRQARAARQSREYTSQHPMPEFPQRSPPIQNSDTLKRLNGPSIPHRPERTITQIPAGSGGLSREGSRRYHVDRSTPQAERFPAGEGLGIEEDRPRGARGIPQYTSGTTRTSVGASGHVGRTSSISRRLRPSNVTVEQ